MNPDKKCVQCEYFVQAGADENIGECHRYAPHSGALDPTSMLKAKGIDIQTSVYWPKVDINTGCGEFEPKAP